VCGNAMSRWSRRSQEEKEAIHAKEMEKLRIRKMKEDAIKHFGKTMKLSFELESEAGIAKYKEILQLFEVPLVCRECGWTFSNKYQMEERSGFLFITGNCKTCDAKSVYMIRDLYSPETMILMQIVSHLEKQGRYTDTRRKKK